MKENVQNNEDEERPEWAWLMKRMTKETQIKKNYQSALN